MDQSVKDFLIKMKTELNENMIKQSDLIISDIKNCLNDFNVK